MTRRGRTSRSPRSSGDDFYARTRAIGFDYGDAFRSIKAAHRRRRLGGRRDPRPGAARRRTRRLPLPSGAHRRRLPNALRRTASRPRRERSPYLPTRIRHSAVYGSPEEDMTVHAAGGVGHRGGDRERHHDHRPPSANRSPSSRASRSVAERLVAHVARTHRQGALRIALGTETRGSPGHGHSAAMTTDDPGWSSSTTSGVGAGLADRAAAARPSRAHRRAPARRRAHRDRRRIRDRPTQPRAAGAAVRSAPRQGGRPRGHRRLLAAGHFRSLTPPRRTSTSASSRSCA